MQNDFFHSPFAAMFKALEEKPEKKPHTSPINGDTHEGGHEPIEDFAQAYGRYTFSDASKERQGASSSLRSRTPKQKQKKHIPSAHAMPSEEEQLFLQTVQHIKPSKKRKQDTFFTLGAHFSAQGLQAGLGVEDATERLSSKVWRKKAGTRGGKSLARPHEQDLAQSALSQKSLVHQNAMGSHTFSDAQQSLKGQKTSSDLQAPLQDDVSMQVLLDAQRPGFMGKGTSLQESTAKEADAFFKAMKDVSPLQGKGRAVIPEVTLSLTPEQKQECFASMMEKNIEFSLSLKGEYLEGHVVGLDELTMNNLRRGVYSPEAHLDLHGLNALQAYTALVGFFRMAWFKGLRTVLLVPGRGKNSPNGVAVLRDKLQLWLTQDPFKRVVLAFCTAQLLDGGAGTVYVLLRKYKKKGKINWERMPADPDLY